ncbi:tyrosine-type recombinase/integrase [Photobacterium lutimaris]|uniref:Integrase n=1 Tax=Photobacterium lutimaris TaxID=388278 RepID=A0A2T3J1M9_9GAMM|nr:tyrosine-type recombinase/integrase [Photobacterium lutimaris]PSU34989.1 integrase [Photobacterium lutimaris]TDR77344.1 site-specific recombinase XerD [Photobacterium lutimaris]
MSVRKQRDGTWLCECYPHGRQGKRVRKKFATKGEATAFERFTLREAEDKPWLGTADDKRRLSDLIELWYHYHGKNIKTGKLYLKILNNMCRQMGNPIAAKCKAKDYTEYRANRTNILMGDGRSVAAETQNLELTLLKAVFNELIRIKEWPLPNPFAEVKKIRSDERELTFLSHEEIRTLLDYVATQNNAEDMTNTKGKRNRTVPISPELYDAIHKPGNGPLFSVNYFPVYMRLRKCFPELPKGQATHVLRHTFASHFMMNGGNILVLQRILGHRDIKQTMVYSHFSPDHLQDAVTKNPLNYL